KLRQMEGTTLATIIKEMQDQTGDVLERRAAQALGASLPVRSEERRVGKECRSRWGPDHQKKKSPRSALAQRGGARRVAREHRQRHDGERAGEGRCERPVLGGLEIHNTGLPGSGSHGEEAACG